MRGVMLEHNKITASKEIEEAKLPKKVVIPLLQHIGKIAKPVVKPKQKVKQGQLIAKADGNISANIHASVSGVVTKIEERPYHTGNNILAIEIKTTGEESFAKRKNIEKLTKQQLLKIIQDSGIVGLGGAMFPTHVKLNAKINILIINGAECEPYITSDHRLMLEHTEEIVKGIKLLIKILNPKKVLIGIEDNKKDAIKALKKFEDNKIKVKTLKSYYPQGAEKTLIYNLTKRKTPSLGLPLDIGVVVQNIGTVKAIFDAVYFNKPLIERIVTVTGDVKKPKNLLVKIGTPINELIKQCSGYKKIPKKIIVGGPMMGIALPNDGIPIIKGNNCVLAIAKPEKNIEEDCIKCGRCIDVCPANIMPNMIANLSKLNKFKEAKEYYALDCTECGLCAYVCPAKIPLVKEIKKAKKAISKLKL